MTAFLTNSNSLGRQAYWITSMHLNNLYILQLVSIIVQLHFAIGYGCTLPFAELQKTSCLRHHYLATCTIGPRVQK